ncbi:hypothetical protein [Sinomicrobium weinanense]|uniref:DUF2946 domain-containing protein n=1 Tax=Sinomicrobium weinanense TaxID=2842200 RepID=A0A926Q2Q6_9FLAO|nr:hypothetical protein [Sinomicrobium weinanense]MBC9796882.1 hypothetical protein [Sinomicrobium weinanense]MBU3123867.1 hypothetical protein [Sinomicrobium weinanense]
MKAFRVHIGFSLIFAVLFSILFQAFHIIDHATDNIPLPSEKQSMVTTSASKCPVCDFKFSVFHTPGILHFTPVETIEPVVYINFYTPASTTFRDKSLALRAPPYNA